MDILDALFLGFVQGLTEWLPVSSSGHLTILQEMRGLQVPLFFDVLLHVVTALVVLIFLRSDIVDIFKSLSRSLRRWRAGERLSEAVRTEEGAMTAWFILIGSVPTAIIAIILRSFIESFFSSLTAVGVALLITGGVLASTYFTRRDTGKGLTTRDSVAIGVVQGLALVPGISRSGTTISTGIFLGADRVKVAKFSFLLAVPTIFGAAIMDIVEGRGATLSIEPLSLAVALIATAIFGFLALKFLMFIISRTRLHVFAPYCLALGAILLLLNLL